MFHEIKKLLAITGQKLRFLALLIMRCPFNAAMTVVNAVFLGSAFNAVTANDSSRLLTVCLIYIFSCLGLFLYNGTIWSIYAPFVVRMEAKLRRMLFRKITTLSCQRIESAGSGEWITRLNTDVQMPFSRPIHLPHAVCAIVNISVSAIILGQMNLTVFYLVLLFVIPHIVLSQLFIARAMPALNKKVLETLALNSGDFAAIITCADTAILYDGQEFLLKRFKNSSLQLMRANMKIKFRNAAGAGILPLFGLGGYLALLAVCGKWIAAGNFSFGDLTAAFQYRGGILVGSMMLVNSLVSIKASTAGINRINDLMSEKTED